MGWDDPLSRFDVSEYIDERMNVGLRSDGSSGTELVLDCPVCGASRKLYVNEKSGLWICYRCGEKGNSTKLVSHVEGISFREARKFVLRGSMDRPSRTVDEIRSLDREEARDSSSRGVTLPEEFIPIFDRGSRTWTVPTYLKERNISPTVAASFGLGFCKVGRYAGRLILPAHIFGAVRTFQGRAMGDFVPKYLGPTGDKKGSILFGVDEAFGAEDVLIVEGPLDVISLAGKGYTAIGLMGKVATMSQATLLKKVGIRRAIVMLDSDARRDAGKVATLLSEVLDEVRIAELPEGLDPDDASPEILASSISSARPPSLRDRL